MARFAPEAISQKFWRLLRHPETGFLAMTITNNKMTTQLLLAHFEKDIKKLIEEISFYKNESDLWMLKGDIKNSPGTLALHITGNLKHFIGAQLGKTGYVRERDKEFADRNIPKENLLKGLNEALEIVKTTFSKLSDDDLKKDFPIPFLEKTRPTLEILFILYGHLNYHLGQVNYHRRLN